MSEQSPSGPMVPPPPPGPPAMPAPSGAPLVVGPTGSALEAAHDAHHRWLHEGLYGVLEALVRADDVVAGRSAFNAIVLDLEAGLLLEEQVVMPAYRALGVHAPQGRPDVVDGDHTILRRTIEAIGERFDALGPAPSLRAVLEALPLVYRLIATLEHHTEREQRHVYPAVAAVLDDVVVNELITTLARHTHLADRGRTS